MISVAILYPKSDDSTFDMDYYTTAHMPMFADRLGEACHSWSVAAPNDRYHATAWVTVDSQDALNATLAAHGAEILGDVANYTNSNPDLIIGEIVV